MMLLLLTGFCLTVVSAAAKSLAMSMPQTTTVRIYYEDTDFSGYVYHAAYLRFFERGRTEFLRSLGAMQSALQRDEAGLVFVVSRITVDYLRPAAMDDLLTIETTVTEARGPVVRFAQAVKRGEETLATAKVLIVAIRNGRPTRLPEHLRAAVMASPAEAVERADP